MRARTIAYDQVFITVVLQDPNERPPLLLGETYTGKCDNSKFLQKSWVNVDVRADTRVRGIVKTQRESQFSQAGTHNVEHPLAGDKSDVFWLRPRILVQGGDDTLVKAMGGSLDERRLKQMSV